MIIINGWKEIAQYVGRGVRTVQRWERDLRFLVHRPKGKDRSAVVAFAEELDTWLHSTPCVNLSEPQVSRISEQCRNRNRQEVRGRTASLTTALMKTCGKEKETTNRLIDLLNRTAGKAALRKRREPQTT